LGIDEIACNLKGQGSTVFLVIWAKSQLIAILDEKNTSPPKKFYPVGIEILEQVKR